MMAKRKVCLGCKMFVDGETCSNCSSNQFTQNWQGRIFISDPQKSIVARKLGITIKGEYAIKVK